MGAPAGNCNAIKSGALRSRYSLTVGKPPAKFRRVWRAGLAVRRAIESAVINARGDISLIDAAVIQTAVRWEITAQLAQRWLLTSTDDLTTDERLRHAKLISVASTERDRCLKSLGLERRGDVLDALYAMPTDTMADEPGGDQPADCDMPSGDDASLGTVPSHVTPLATVPSEDQAEGENGLPIPLADTCARVSRVSEPST
jgi:hypothetical protein